MRADAVANRGRVLAAAAAVFGEQGVEASTEEVARRAGVGVGTVFRHFPTKRDLVEAALVAHFEELAVAASRAGFVTLMAEMAETGSTKLAMARYLVEGGAGLGDRVTTASEALRAVVGAVLRRAQDDGTVRPDVGVDEVYYLLHALAQVRTTTPADPEVRRRAVEVVLAGLRG